MIENPFSLSFGMKPVSYFSENNTYSVVSPSSRSAIDGFFDINGISIFYLMRKTKQTLSANICIDVKNKERIRRSLMQ